MLILRRRENEAIRIDGCIKITVVKTSEGYVSIGIDAPSTVKVLRDELVPFDESIGSWENQKKGR